MKNKLPANLKTDSSLLKTVLVIAAALIIICAYMSSPVFAADKENRGLVLYYCSVDDYRGKLISYQHQGMLYNGETGTFTAEITHPDPEIWVLNDIGQTYTSLDPDIVDIKSQGMDDLSRKAFLEFRKTGTAVIRVDVPATGLYEAYTAYFKLTVKGTRNVFTRSVTNDSGTAETAISSVLYDGDTYETGFSFYRDDKEPKLYIDRVSFGEYSYEYSSSDESVLSIDKDGNLTLHGTGTATVTATAEVVPGYRETIGCIVKVADRPDNDTSGSSLTGSNSDSGASSSSSSASSSSSVKKVKVTLKKPKLKCSKRMKRANKLTWNKVQGASGYILYVKYPGTKKFVKAVTRKSNIKSVTHRGLTRKKKYCYKVRAYTRKNGKIYYGPYSKVVKVKVK